jgi:uracil-DNA glycosylase family 4
VTASAEEALAALSARLVECRRCPRLVAWREQVALDKRAAFRDDDYWGRPVPGFGDAAARLLIVGLAPAAHGANRTGRMFTGDRSGDWLFRALYRAGFANQPSADQRGDGLTLRDAWVTAAVRCAPPKNRPTAAERDTCGAWLDAELGLLERVEAIVCLGGYGYAALWASLRRRGADLPRPRPRFSHGGRIDLADVTVLLSYHPSQQNTFTGRLTEPMFDAVFATARGVLDRTVPGGDSALG